MYREYAADAFTPAYSYSLTESVNLQQYAEKQSKIYGEEKCAKMRENFVDYKKNKKGGMKELPQGMTRYDGDPKSLPVSGKRKRKTK